MGEAGYDKHERELGSLGARMAATERAAETASSEARSARQAATATSEYLHTKIEPQLALTRADAKAAREIAERNETYLHKVQTITGVLVWIGGALLLAIQLIPALWPLLAKLGATKP